MSILSVPTNICKWFGLGPLWALCFYHFRCTMPSVPAAAPFASVSACHTTFMELIIPLNGQLLALYSLFNQWLSAFHQVLGLQILSPGTSSWNGKLCAPVTVLQSLDVRVRVRLSNVCYVHSSIPFHSFCVVFLVCVLAFCVLRSVAFVIFFHMFTAWIFYGLKCFQLESFALFLCVFAPCTLLYTRTHINSLD